MSGTKETLGSRKVKRSWGTQALAWTGAVTGAATLLVTYLGFAKAVDWWPFDIGEGITIASRVHPIARCATLTGWAELPPGYSLWVAQHGAGQSGHYNLTQVSFENPGKWHVTMTVGPANAEKQKFTIDAFALDSQATDLLKNVQLSGKKAFYYLSSLPGSGLPVAVQSVRRDKISTQAC